jgi:hypothetical protein
MSKKLVKPKKLVGDLKRARPIQGHQNKYSTITPDNINKAKIELDKEFKSDYIHIKSMQIRHDDSHSKRVRVVVNELPSWGDEYYVESIVYGVVAKHFGTPKSVWEPAFDDDGWAFNYVYD